MLNNITNFFNLIKTGKVKTQLDGTDLLPIGTRDTRYSGQYQPTMIKYSDLVDGMIGGSDGQVLFKDNGIANGAANLYWDKVNDRLTGGPVQASAPWILQVSQNSSSNNTNLMFYSPGAWGGLLTMPPSGYYNTMLNGRIIGTDGGVGNSALALGTVTANTSGSNFNIAIGPSSNVTGAKSLAVGYQAVVTTDNATAIGFGATTSTLNGFALGNANSLLQIGGNFTPLARVHIKGQGNNSATTALNVQNSLGEATIIAKDDRTVGLGRSSFSNEAYGGIAIGYPNLGNIVYSVYDTHTFSVYTNTGYDTALSIKGNGSASRVLIGTTIDAGYKLDVNGTFRALVSTETNPFVVQHTNGNYASIVIGNGTQFAPGQFGMHFNGAGVWSWSGNAFRIHGGILTSNANAITFQLIGGFGGSTLGTSIKLGANTFNAGQFTATSGNQNTVEIGTTNNETWAPTSGNATYNLFVVAPRINTSGTYAGIVRGIIYAPTLTSITGVDHRAIETTAGNVIFNGGNVGIGTSSPTNKLEVNGNIRATSALLANDLITINNSSAGANATVIFNSTSPFFYSNAYAINFGSTSNGGGVAFTNGVLQVWNQLNLNNLLILSDGNTTANERLRVTKGGNLLIGTTTDAGYKLDVNGTSRFVSSFRCEGQATFISSIIATAQVRIGTNPVAASAVLDVQSTTQGFLPPRLTTTEKNAIATPAAGLMVYDNTLNRPCFYNGTSWITL